MAAYVIADITVLNPEAYEEYRRQVPAVIEAYGGRYLVRGGAVAVFEGDWQPSRLVVLEFPDMGALRRWYRSDDYQILLRIRQRAARTHLIAVEGV
jgi:uncharacterized protein (DUF1330 family)